MTKFSVFTHTFFRLKSFNTPESTVYTVAQINTYPLPIYAVQILTSESFLSDVLREGGDQCWYIYLSAFAYAWWSDAVRARWPPMVLAGVCREPFLLNGYSFWQLWSMAVSIVLAATPLYSHITRWVSA